MLALCGQGKGFGSMNFPVSCYLIAIEESNFKIVMFFQEGQWSAVLILILFIRYFYCALWQWRTRQEVEYWSKLSGFWIEWFEGFSILGFSREDLVDWFVVEELQSVVGSNLGVDVCRFFFNKSEFVQIYCKNPLEYR